MRQKCLDSFGVEETIVGVSESIESFDGISANPKGMVDVIKNRIMIRDKTDFNSEFPLHKNLQQHLGVEFDLQKFGVENSLED